MPKLELGVESVSPEPHEPPALVSAHVDICGNLLGFIFLFLVVLFSKRRHDSAQNIFWRPMGGRKPLDAENRAFVFKGV